MNSSWGKKCVNFIQQHNCREKEKKYSLLGKAGISFSCTSPNMHISESVKYYFCRCRDVAKRLCNSRIIVRFNYFYGKIAAPLRAQISREKIAVNCVFLHVTMPAWLPSFSLVFMLQGTKQHKYLCMLPVLEGIWMIVIKYHIYFPSNGASSL